MISILHGADLHLDSPFSGLSEQQAAHCRSMQREIPAKLVELAHRRNCQIILLAGDIFDGTCAYPETVESLRQALSMFRGRVFIAPGNHDPYTDTSLWAREAWPENVYIFKGPTQSIVLGDLGCRIWGGGFTSAQCFEGLPQVERQGFMEIGVFHGDPETTGPYRSISKESIENSGLDYLALGHIHKTSMPRRIGNTWCGWPGAAVGRGFDETGVRGVFHVMLEGENCCAELIPLPGPRYEIIHWPAGAELRDLLPADPENVICRLICTGQKDGEALPDLSHLFFSLDLRDEREQERDIWQDHGLRTLKGLTLSRLKQQYDAAATEQQRQAAELAARYVIAALEGRESP